ncbi:hypothetical protein FDP25_02575 [Roseovarius sp. A21]|uniref:Uncharacterized protein n=1 Tax=Roseovarius bejariae TaxID=2576383 RepID=A0A844CI20_9RHOB|nr:hypothetical protein [Roseovarius bejariae]MRU14307.1 hypothetical protein [Roseovarius bejariae]
MRLIYNGILIGVIFGAATPALSADFQTRMIGGSVQLGGELVISIMPGDKTMPSNAKCSVEVPEPYSGHLELISSNCSAMKIQQAFEPIRDENGYAIPSTDVPYNLIVANENGQEVGRVNGIFPYNNQFSDLRIHIKDVKNPVSPGESFQAVVLGAGEPISESLLCRWATYGPVAFEPMSENKCSGRITALEPQGRDGDMNVEIVNLKDMHAVGYAISKIIVE